MEELTTKIEMAKGFLYELLRDAGLLQLYSDSIIENYFFDPFSNTSNAYKAALNIFDTLINS